MKIKGLPLALSLFMTASATAQVLTTQDTTIGGVGAGAFMVYQSVNGLKNIEAEIAAQSQALQSEVTALKNEADGNRTQAKQLEAGLPRANTRELYNGNFINGDDYHKYAGEAAQMNDNKYRLQADGARKLAEKLAKESELADKQITLMISRVAGETHNEGSTNYNIKMDDGLKFTGTPAEVGQKLIDAASKQDAKMAMGSIVKVELHYTTIDAPNPAAAAKLLQDADAIEKKLGQKSSTLQERIATERTKRLQVLKRLKRFRTGGIALIAGSVFLGMVRHSMAQDMITLSHACLDAEALETQAAGLALQSGQNEDQVLLQLETLCAR